MYSLKNNKIKQNVFWFSSDMGSFNWKKLIIVGALVVKKSWINHNISD